MSAVSVHFFDKEEDGVIRPILVLMAVVLISGCSTMTPARYSVSVDTNQTLRGYAGAKVVLTSLAEPSEYSANCRLMGPIRAGDGLTIPQFIQQAFNDEFKFADLYDPAAGTKLTGTVDKIAFSSISGLTNGWWDLGLTLSSPSGGQLSVENRHEFKSGYGAITACNQTAQALGAAVQDLIKKTVADPRFTQLIREPLARSSARGG